MARDVRFLAAILEIITELERIGDYAKGICKITQLISEEEIEPVLIYDLEQMANFGLDMLRRALDAFVAGDSTTARAGTAAAAPVQPFSPADSRPICVSR